MKQIYNLYKSLNRFEKYLLYITTLSIIILFILVLDLLFIPNCFNTSLKVINNTNELLSDISIGIISSFVFYVIVQWLPDKYKEKKSLKIIYKNLKKASDEIDSLIATYNRILFRKKDINELIKEDFKKITFFELYKCDFEDFQTFKNNREEIIFIFLKLTTIFNEIGVILKSPYIESVPYELISKFYELRDLNFYEEIIRTQNMHDYFNTDKLNLELNGYNFSQIYIDEKKDFLSENLFAIYEINKIFKKYLPTSSSSKQSS